MYIRKSGFSYETLCPGEVSSLDLFYIAFEKKNLRFKIKKRITGVYVYGIRPSNMQPTYGTTGYLYKVIEYPYYDDSRISTITAGYGTNARSR